MADFAELRTEKRRLAILQLLKQDPDYSANDALLQESLQLMGHGAGIAAVRADLQHLCEIGCVALKDLPGCYVATLRDTGVDVACGVSSAPGVARPRPGEMQ
jgi:hypothetical protein